jgi:large subunit ribosomal protein L22
MEYKAEAKHIHTSTRKLRLIADSIRKLSPANALVALNLMPKQAAKPMAKVVSSALANIKQKGAGADSFRFKTIEVMGAGAMKRWHATSKGQAHAYKKRMTHVRVTLTDEGVK